MNIKCLYTKTLYAMVTKMSMVNSKAAKEEQMSFEFYILFK